MPECVFAHLGDCQGPTMVKAHLVPKGRLKKELRRGYSEAAISWAIWDDRCWRWMCGGASRLGGHHGRYDSHQIALPWPDDFLEFLDEYGISWMAEAYAR